MIAFCWFGTRFLLRLFPRALLSASIRTPQQPCASPLDMFGIPQQRKCSSGLPSPTRSVITWNPKQLPMVTMHLLLQRSIHLPPTSITQQAPLFLDSYTPTSLSISFKVIRQNHLPARVFKCAKGKYSPMCSTTTLNARAPCKFKFLIR